MRVSIALVSAFALGSSAVAAQGLGDLVGAVRDAADQGSADAVSGAGLSGELSNSWRSSSRSRFHHVLEGAPGRYRLTIRATTSSPGGETVAVYPQTSAGERGSPRIGFVIATTQGNAEEMFVTIPQPPEGQTQGSLPIVVDVENASGREYSGNYSLELQPA